MTKGADSNSLGELNRIRTKGFELWPLDQNEVFVHKDLGYRLSELISFPTQSYGNDSPNLESFWVDSRASLIYGCLRLHNQSTIWEIGAGDGKVAIPLKRKGITVLAAEPIYDGARNIAAQGIPTFAASLNQLSLPSKSISAIGIFDVLEHIEDPSLFLAELKRVLEEGGLLFITVPAHQWLFSDFDSSIGHFRRYSRKSLDKELTAAGFERITNKHFFASLVLPALALRRIPYLLGRRRSFAGESGVSKSSKRHMNPNRVVNSLAKTLLRLDSHLKLPFGLSIIGVYRSS